MVAQCIISRCRALISIQPIRNSDAVLLDQQISGKVHQCLGFPYQPNTDIQTLPLSHFGMKFPSVVHINIGIAVEGLTRDFNHHIHTYWLMARINLADWTCSINNCINFVDSHGLIKTFTQYYQKIPASWIIAQKAMSTLSLKLSLCLTDCNYILQGNMSISHALNICHVHRFIVPDG